MLTNSLLSRAGGNKDRDNPRTVFMSARRKHSFQKKSLAEPGEAWKPQKVFEAKMRAFFHLPADLTDCCELRPYTLPEGPQSAVPLLLCDWQNKNSNWHTHSWTVCTLDLVRYCL